MNYEYIRNHYRVPAETGRRVRYKGREGVIVSSEGQYVNIHFDGNKKRIGPFHPVDGMEYLGMGEVPKLTRAQRNYLEYREVADAFDNFQQWLRYKEAQRKKGF